MTEHVGFPDHRGQFFGREEDVRYLLSRAKRPGLTAIVARPKMGKTWLLEETARLLSTEQSHLVGYHECKGQLADLMLRAVSDLYARWLADARMWQQARSIWERHKDNLITGAGKAVGRIFSAVAALPSRALAPVGDIVREAFDALAAANRDLTTGGLELKRLDYDQARELVQIVARVSARPLVLILDAWEQSPSLRQERRTLELVLSHLADWPEVHVFLGVRRPHHDEAQPDHAYLASRDLAASNPAAEVYDLQPMRLDLPGRETLLAYLRRSLQAARAMDDDELLSLIDNFPGVVGYWMDANRLEAVAEPPRLRALADDAQAYRYRELDAVLPHLDAEQCNFAVRLAMLPRLDRDWWRALKDVLLDGISVGVCRELAVKCVLESIDPPDFGHDTRHRAARRWFLQRPGLLPLLRQEVEGLAFGLAERIRGIDRTIVPFAAALGALCDPARRLDADRAARALPEAARSLFGVTDADTDWHVFQQGWRAAIERTPCCTTLVGAALVNRGLAKGRAGDTAGEVGDYTAVVGMPDAPADQKAQALVNRGVVKGRAGDTAGEIADYTAVVEMPDAPAAEKAQALFSRGVVKGRAGDTAGAIADCTAVVEMPDAPAAEKAQALFGRGVVKGRAGDTAGAIADYTAVVEMPDAPADQKAKALFSRRLVKRQAGDTAGAIADYTAVVDMPDAPAVEKALALVGRAEAKWQGGDTAGAIADWTAVVETPDAPAEVRARVERLIRILSDLDGPEEPTA